MKLFLIIGYILWISCSKSVDFQVILSQIDQHHLGQTFLNALQIGLSSGSPVNEIQSYLNNIRFMLEQEQKEADIFIQSTQAKCQRLLHDFSTNYAYHSSQLLANQKIMQENTENLQRALNKIAEVSVEIEQNIMKTNAGQSERDLQYSEFQTTIKDHNEAISAIDEAYALIEHLANGSSFIQVKGRFNKVINRLTQQSSGITHLFLPIINMMSQLASNTDEAKKLLLLLSGLKVQILEVKSKDEDLEKVAALNWQQFSNDLINEQNTLSDQRQNLEQAILNYQSIIEESKEKSQYHQIEFIRNKENVENQDIWCRQQQDLYSIDSQSRNEASSLVSKIIDHMQDKIVTLKEYLRERHQIQ
ncbi:unnamed protein product [Paramecium pentaurelia]|uniref:Trichocyst matrix protein n=1 Tax=Paramecium pentaurelia TaxID=43138 RepID=A0A8S1UU87_9CILI|nr:unnamed protein product [Paramecium pentaurelia]